MQLLLDIGNTRIKWGALDGGALAATGELRGESPFEALARELETPAAIWVASVRDDAFEAGLAAAIKACWPETPVHWPRTRAEGYGVACAYPEPETMGVDRWLALLAARRITGEPVCVVDAGSAVTLDALDPLGRHLGGLILPGLGMARRLMHERTARVRVAEDYRPRWWTDNTSDALNSGTHWAVVCLLERFRAETEQRLAARCGLVLTGGDAPAIMASLAEPGRHEPHLVLKGLAVMAEDKGASD